MGAATAPTKNNGGPGEEHGRAGEGPQADAEGEVKTHDIETPEAGQTQGQPELLMDRKVVNNGTDQDPLAL